MAQSIDPEPLYTNNGASNGHTNGSSEKTNGSTSAKTLDAEAYEGDQGFKPLWQGSEIDRREFVRLTLEALREIGYNSAAQALSTESGFELESDAVIGLRNGILSGQWPKVEKLLLEIPSESLRDLKTIQFAIGEERFLEALEVGATKKALAILRQELAPLNHDAGRLHLLSSWIMCSRPDDLRLRADWPGVAGGSRQVLLQKLQRYISPKLMLPHRRLEVLLEQAKSYQRSNCLYHATDAPISLLADCNCSPDTFPCSATHILRGHEDEIWRLEFSHDGNYLATAGRDMTARIWDVQNDFALLKVLRGHVDHISCLAWAPDDTLLLTGADMVLKMWNASTGECINTLEQHTYPIGALAWLPDGRSFVSGGMDSRIWFWDLAGHMHNILPNVTSRILDLAVTPDGKRLVVVGRGDSHSTRASHPGTPVGGSRGGTPGPTITRHEKRICVFDLEHSRLEYQITQPGELTSVRISADSRFAIISHAPNEIIYLELRDGTILRRFRGHDQGDWVLQSCFGGALENYVLSGSEDGKIYVWHRETGVVVHILEGHGSGSVNAVAWNNRHHGMFASAADDRTVRVWQIAPKQNGFA